MIPGITVMGAAAARHRIELGSHTIANIGAPYGGTQTVAKYTIDFDGTVTDQDDNILDHWLGIAGDDPSNYELQVVVTSGSLDSTISDPINSWIRFSTFTSSTARSWGIKRGSPGYSEAVFTISVRDIATKTVQATASITLQVTIADKR